MSYSTRVLLARCAVLGAMGAALEIGPRLLGPASRLAILPMSEMLVGVYQVAASGKLFEHLLVSLVSIAIAFVSSTILGIAIGYALWKLPRVYRAISSYLTSYYAIPIFAFYPVLIVMFGANRVPIVLIAFAWAIVAVIIATVEGLAHLRPSWDKVADAYHVGPFRRAVTIHLSGAWPQIATGVRLAVTYSMLGVIASEFILSDSGIGYLVHLYYNSFAFKEMWGAILVVFALGILLDSASRFGTRRLTASR